MNLIDQVLALEALRDQLRAEHLLLVNKFSDLRVENEQLHDEIARLQKHFSKLNAQDAETNARLREENAELKAALRNRADPPSLPAQGPQSDAFGGPFPQEGSVNKAAAFVADVVPYAR
jgi:serine phosphatase RsbU (regulator of sigma subunit)